jgi:hypothetical protein
VLDDRATCRVIGQVLERMTLNVEIEHVERSTQNVERQGT